MTSAELLATIDAQIEREFSFAQELIWSHPHENPYPLCTDKIIAGMTKLRNFLQDVDLDRSRGMRKRAKRVARVVEQDAQTLIDCRLKYIQRMGNSSLRDDVEKSVDGIIVRHMNNAWPGAEESVPKMLQAGGVDWRRLDSDIAQLFESPPDMSDLMPAKDEIVKAAIVDDLNDLPPAEVLFQQESSPTDMQRENADVRGLLQGQLTFLVAASASHDTQLNTPAKPEASADGEEFPGNLLPNLTELAAESSISVHPPAMSSTRRPDEKLKATCGPALAVSMSMKATLCGVQSSEPRWHILFSLINKGADSLAVDSLSIWSLFGETRPSTIRWPKGDVVLKAESSFLCYSTQWPCNGTYNSPMVGYTWSYRTTAQAARNPEAESAEIRVHPGDNQASLRKRLQSVVSWMSSVKKRKSI